jgi:hypothetical protein
LRQERLSAGLGDLVLDGIEELDRFGFLLPLIGADAGDDPGDAPRSSTRTIFLTGLSPWGNRREQGPCFSITPTERGAAKKEQQRPPPPRGPSALDPLGR